MILVTVLVLLAENQSHCPIQSSIDTDFAIVQGQISHEGIQRFMLDPLETQTHYASSTKAFWIPKASLCCCFTKFQSIKLTLIPTHFSPFSWPLRDAQRSPETNVGFIYTKRLTQLARWLFPERCPYPMLQHRNCQGSLALRFPCILCRHYPPQWGRRLSNGSPDPALGWISPSSALHAPPSLCTFWVNCSKIVLLSRAIFFRRWKCLRANKLVLSLTL